MKQKYIIIVIVSVVVIGVASFLSGMVAQRVRMSHDTRAPFAFERQMGMHGRERGDERGEFFKGAPFMGRGRIAGTIVSKDDKNITVKLLDGSTQVIPYTDTTTVQTTQAGSASDLVSGKHVLISRTRGADGTMTATQVNIVPNQ